MINKHQFRVQQPLLSQIEINECIQQGHSWSASDLFWSIRETRLGTSGDLLSQLQGSGIDYSDTRPYQTGDEPRHINWRATARVCLPQMRVFHEDVTPHSYFLIDRRSSMRFGTRKRLKATQAARLAIFLASWEAQKNTKLGSLVLNDTPQWQAAMSGQPGLYQLAQLSTTACPPLSKKSSFSLQHAFSLLNKNIPLGSHIYLLSDFYDLQKEMLPQLYQLGQQYNVIAIGLYDEAERTLPDAGLLGLSRNLTDEIEKNTLVNTHDISIKNQYHLAFEKKQTLIKELFDSAGINFISVCSSSDELSIALGSTPL